MRKIGEIREKTRRRRGGGRWNEKCEAKASRRVDGAEKARRRRGGGWWNGKCEAKCGGTEKARQWLGAGYETEKVGNKP